MLRIHKRLFYEHCDKNIDTYNEIISQIRHEYLAELSIAYRRRNENIQKQIHNIINLVLYLDNNSEMLYLCRAISNNCKWGRAIYNYSPHLEELLTYNIDRLLSP